jgi:ribonuclease-3
VTEASGALRWVEAQLGYHPRDAALFVRALTHRSAGGAHNERLEFLGDAIVNFVAAEFLYRQFPDADEGVLSRLRASVVSGESLARVAARFALGDALVLGAGELKTGGFRRESILADALEAVVGALYLEAGFDAARSAVLRLLGDSLSELVAHGELRDAKTQLQEWLQARGLPLPRYTVESVAGEAHAQYFDVSCEIDTPPVRTRGEGSSRRRAEQAAAQALLEQVCR